MIRFPVHLLVGLFALLLLAGCMTVLPVPIVLPGDAPAAEVGSSTEAPGQAGDARGSASPEAAIAAFLEAVAGGDMPRALDVSAAAQMGRKVDFVAHVDRLRSFMVYQSPLPANDDLFMQLNRMRIEQQLSVQTATFVTTLLAGDRIDLNSGVIAPVDAAWAGDVAQLFDAARLTGITIESIVLSDADLMASERYLENAGRIAAVWGAEESTERLAHFTFEGNAYVLGFSLLRYDDRWYVNSLSSPIAGTPLGVPLRQ